MVRACLDKPKPLAHAVGADDNNLTIYASSLDRKPFLWKAMRL
jgi:hypothetical protein